MRKVDALLEFSMRISFSYKRDSVENNSGF